MSTSSEQDDDNKHDKRDKQMTRCLFLYLVVIVIGYIMAVMAIEQKSSYRITGGGFREPMDASVMYHQHHHNTIIGAAAAADATAADATAAAAADHEIDWTKRHKASIIQEQRGARKKKGPRDPDELSEEEQRWVLFDYILETIFSGRNPSFLSHFCNKQI